MNNEIVTDNGGEKPSVIRALAARYNVEPKQLYAVLKETIAPKATEAQLAAFCIVCHEYGLNPITKEIYAFPGKGGEIVPMVGVDGWIHLMNAHPQFDGFQADVREDGSACTVRIHRKDRSYPVEITEYLDECKRSTEPWRQAPKRMLRHKAIIQAARLAFGFSGIYDEDEARDVAGVPQRAAVGRVVPAAVPPALVDGAEAPRLFDGCENLTNAPSGLFTKTREAEPMAELPIGEVVQPAFIDGRD